MTHVPFVQSSFRSLLRGPLGSMEQPPLHFNQDESVTFIGMEGLCDTSPGVFLGNCRVFISVSRIEVVVTSFLDFLSG